MGQAGEFQSLSLHSENLLPAAEVPVQDEVATGIGSVACGSCDGRCATGEVMQKLPRPKAILVL